MIQFSAVAKRYPNGHEALRDVSFTMQAGELAVVTGPSGAGKSTLLKLASGIERATRGGVVVNGQNLSTLGETALAVLRRNIGFVFQDHKLLFDRPAGENVALPLRIAGARADEAGRRVRAALDKVGLLAREKAMPITLSGGEQQRLCIARAILELFLSFHRVGVTVLLSTHDESSLAQLGGRRLAIRDGALAGAAA